MHTCNIPTLMWVLHQDDFRLATSIFWKSWACIKKLVFFLRSVRLPLQILSPRTYIHTYMHACIHPCIHASMHPCIHASIHPCIHTPMPPYIHTSIHPYIHTYIHTSIHPSIHPYIHTYIQTYKLTFTRLQALPSPPPMVTVPLSPGGMGGVTVSWNPPSLCDVGGWGGGWTWST